MLPKSTLRLELLARRKALSMGEWQTRSEVIVARVRELCNSLRPRAVALYAPIVKQREVDVSSLDQWFRDRDVSVAYPVMTATTRGFTWTTPSSMSVLGGFLQPNSCGILLQPGELDLVIVPALGVTTAGYRLGYGAGFYDEQLRRFCPPAISVCVAFAEQVLNELPLEAHDVPCNRLVTDQ